MQSKPVLPLAVRPLEKEEPHNGCIKSKLVYRLNSILDDWKDYRLTTIESTWTKADSNFKGEFDAKKGKQNPNSNWRSKAFYPLTEQKVTTAQAQLQDILFKGGKFPYDIKGSPIPDDPQIQADAEKGAEGGAIENPELINASANAKANLEQRIKNMKKRLDDQFAECDAASVGLMSIYDGALYGTAFLESPKTIRKKRYKWVTKGNNYVKKEVYEDVPTVVNLNPWDCFPDPECKGLVQDGIGFFHRERMSTSALYDLHDLVFPENLNMKGTDSETYEYEYIQDQFDALLDDITEDEGSGGSPSTEYVGPNTAEDTGHENRVHEVYTFAGSIQNKYLKNFIDDLRGDRQFTEIIAVFCNERILKCVINPFPGFRRPFHMIPWSKLPGQPFGRGVAEKIFDAQKNVNHMIRLYIDNKRLSGNLMTAIDSDKIKRGSDISIYPGKNWEFEGSIGDTDVRKLIQAVALPDITGGVLEAIGTMVSWADQSSGVPAILEGQAGQSASTAYAENQRLAGASKQLGLVLKNFDIYAWVPIVESFYDWNMEFLKDPNIKGDYNIIATGFSTFENKHLRKLDLERLLLMSQQMQALSIKVKSDPIVEDWALAANIDPERYLLSPEEVAQKIQKSQEDQMNNQASMLQMEQQKQNMEHQFEISLERAKGEMSHHTRMSLAQINAHSKQLGEETKRMSKLADIETKDREINEVKQS